MRSSAALLCAVSAFFFLISLKQGTVHDPGFVMMWYLVLGRVYWFEQQALEDHLDEHDHEDLDGDDLLSEHDDDLGEDDDAHGMARA